MNLLDLTRHSRQLLAESYLEAGFSDLHNLDSELDFLGHSEPGVFQPDEDNDHEGDDDLSEEIIYDTECVFQLILYYYLVC